MVTEKIEAPAKISNRHPAAGPKEDGLMIYIQAQA